MKRPEPRFRVDFSVYLTWQDKGGLVRRSSAKCRNLSASGALIETDYPLQPQSGVMVHSDSFGRMGHAVVRYCRRQTMKYNVGLMFSADLALSDSMRKEIFEKATEIV